HNSMKLKKYKKKIAKAKKECRSELKPEGWSRFGFASLDFWIQNDDLERIDYHTVSKKEFVKRFESVNKPVVICGVMDDWPALERWTPENLLKQYRYEKFRIGEDDDEKAVYMQLKYYLHYALNDPQGACLDDSPLYIFDGRFGTRTEHYSGKRKRDGTMDPQKSQAPCHLLQDYKIPKYFDDDFFKLTGSRRPPYRWVVWGPARSGTGIHTDPLGTSAWNALLSGHKRWALFPPTTPPSIYAAKGSGDYEAVTWFARVYPKMMEPFGETGKTVGEHYGMLDLIQKPGETVFVPSGWAHVVLNLDFSVAVTQNFCSPTNLEQVWLKTRYARPKLAKKMRENMIRFEDKSKKRKRDSYKRLAESLECLDTIPALPTSSDSSNSSSSSESDSEEESCTCHNIKPSQLE
ncbi:hypothetical protein EDD86DRAFT_187953, partial [Gorgonomyces haynaldii]